MKLYILIFAVGILFVIAIIAGLSSGPTAVLIWALACLLLAPLSFWMGRELGKKMR